MSFGPEGKSESNLLSKICQKEFFTGTFWPVVQPWDTGSINAFLLVVRLFISSDSIILKSHKENLGLQ